MKRPIVDIQTLVAAHFNLTRDELLSRDRHRRIARPRQVAMYLTYQPYSSRSLGQVAMRFGMRDHTTVIHACRNVERLRAADPAFDATVREIEREIGRSSTILLAPVTSDANRMGA